MDHKSLFALLNVPGVGILRARYLIQRFGSPEAVLSAPLKELASVPDIGLKVAENIVHSAPDWEEIERQIEQAQKFDARIVTLWDEDYPARLKEIYDPPLFLFVQGNLSCLNQPAVAIVGTRKPSHYGITQTGSIARELAQKGITVISGLARGIDSEAHKGALEGGGITVAVLGCGLDINYPRENKNLCQSILEQGAVLSEFYFGTPPESKNFPRRNRVISGLSSGVLVTEAGERSGALITAAYGIDQNREVFALPGNVDRVQSKGCHNLIKSGRAHLITCAHDILEILNTQLDLKFDKTPPPEIHLPKELEKLYHSIDTEPMYIDEIALKAELSSSETLTKLLELEMMDLIKQLPGKWFQRG